MTRRWSRSVASEAELPRAAAELAVEIEAAAGPDGVVALEGEMGAGKTTTVRALGAVWGFEAEVASPTFALVHAYRTRAGKAVYHMDLYRLENESEAMEIGLEEYYDGPGICLVEWADRAAGLLPPDAVRLRITATPMGVRTWELLVP